MIKKLWAFIFLAALLNPGIYAEVFRFRYTMDDQYRILSTVREEVYINGGFSHEAEIFNRIAVRVTKTADDSGYLEADFQTSERIGGMKGVYQWSEVYESKFWRNSLGRYAIEPQYFMPVVRDVPMFPERDIEPGESWIARGEEAHDFRSNFNIPVPFTFPITVNYEYRGKGDFEGKQYDVISIRYTVFHRPAVVPRNAALYPVRLSGYSDQLLYWDNQEGQPYAYQEEFEFVFQLSSGDQVEYRGSAEAKVIESIHMNKEDMLKSIQEELSKDNLKDTTVRSDERGITISLENIQFKPDSTEMLATEQVKLDAIAAVLKKYPDRDILITGHTALAGTEAGRQQLSEERARVVGDYLLLQGVRTKEHIVIQGKGAREPVADNRTEEGMKKNRRVEITILEN
ncbi:MAG: OmpA family protein [Spirochaetales bacterium]|nr:MAG: OmpA family protein [Spirochaetales bacterium]